MNGGIVLTLRLTPGSDPIAGWLSRADGTSVPFFGYTALIAALESVREQEAQTPAPEVAP